MKKFEKGGKVLLVLLLVFVIPLIIALFILNQNMDKSLKKGSVSSVTLLLGEEKKEIENEKDLDFLIRLAQSGEPIEKTADPLASYRKCQATFHKLTQDITYTFYFSDSVYNCVYVDGENVLHLIPEDLAADALAHPLLGKFAVSYASYPTLTFTQGGKTYNAAESRGNWIYSKTNETESAKKVLDETKDLVVLPQGEAWNFAFSLVPDFASVMLTGETGEVLFTGKIEEMQVLSLEKDTNLTLTVQCDWYEESHAEYHGSITYTFHIFYDIPTSVTLDKTSAAPGETVIVTVQNSSSEQVAVSATFATEKVRPLKSSGVWSIEVSVSGDATPGDYSMMIMGSDVETTVPFTIVPFIEGENQ